MSSEKINCRSDLMLDVKNSKSAQCESRGVIRKTVSRVSVESPFGHNENHELTIRSAALTE